MYWIRKPVSIWCDHLPHTARQAVECYPTPLKCLGEIAGYWQELEHAVVHIIPEHPKLAQCVTCLVSI
jgi:hypothetical protein